MAAVSAFLTSNFNSSIAYVPDYSSRFKNSTGPIDIATGSTLNQIIWNGNIDSSNTGGMYLRDTSTIPTIFTINGSNSYSGTTIDEMNGTNLVLGNNNALSTGNFLAEGGTLISASTNLTLPNNFYINQNGNLAMQGAHSITVNGECWHRVRGTGNNRSFNNNLDPNNSTLTLAGGISINRQRAASTGYFLIGGIGNTVITSPIAEENPDTGQCHSA